MALGSNPGSSLSIIELLLVYQLTPTFDVQPLPTAAADSSDSLDQLFGRKRDMRPKLTLMNGSRFRVGLLRKHRKLDKNEKLDRQTGGLISVNDEPA